MSEDRRNEEELLDRLRRDAATLAEPFELRYASIGKTRRDARIYGCCDLEGHIRIRLRSRISGGFLRYSSLLATLCHELAHLEHFNHGKDFRALNERLLAYARVVGLYRPARGAARPAPAPAPPAVVAALRPALVAASRPKKPKRGARLPDPRQLTLFPPDDVR